MKYTPIESVLNFVDRTTRHGVPLRIAIQRAGRRYGINPALVRAFYRSR